MPSPSAVARHMPRQGRFKGDADHLVDALTAACQRTPTPTTALKERELVPFFSPSQADNAQFATLQRGKTPVKDGAVKPKTAGKTGKRREPAGKQPDAPAATASRAPLIAVAARSSNRSPPRKRAEHAAAATPQATASPLLLARYAGPGFTNSPMPEALPLPTASLLMLDGLRRQLVL